MKKNNSKKTSRFLLPLLFLSANLFFLLNCCLPMKNAVDVKKYNRYSAVRLIHNHDTKICNKKKKCFTLFRHQDFGSGSVIWSDDKYTYILTAEHVIGQEKEIPPIIKQKIAKRGHSIKIITSSIRIDFINGQTARKYEVIATDKVLDLAIIRIKKVRAKNILVSLREPKIGDLLLNTAAPMGFMSRNMIPFFKGDYLGKSYTPSRGKLIVVAFSNFPAVGGSSGSAVMNDDGELIGVVIRKLKNFEHITYITEWSATYGFIYSSLHKYGFQFRKKYN